MTTTQSQKADRKLSRLYLGTTVCVILVGLTLRVVTALSYPLWVDEAESSINGLTIVGHGLPVHQYLGQPIYENTLTEPDPDSEEYEFRDSSYSDRGLVVYHGWLPLYSIAAAQALAGMRPDEVGEIPYPQHDETEFLFRTIVPRSPALLFSAVYLTGVFLLVRQISGPAAGLTALTWLAIGFYGIRFGHQARYYSLTLMMSLLCAAAAWRVYRRGRMKDYVLLALAEAALFHTHQLSAVVFALTCILMAPAILKQERWLLKCTVAGGLASLLTVPWAIWSGFFDTASDLPKAFELFDSLQDWFAYIVERPAPFIVLAGLTTLIAVAIIRPGRRAKSWLPVIPPQRRAAYLFLGGWMVSAYAAFHLLVPAASFFFERLTLIAITPFALYMGMILAEFYPRRRPALALPVALLLPLLILFLTKDLPRRTASFPPAGEAMASVFRFLEQHPPEGPRKIYATPNQHLVWTYYGGLPVQSVAPIDRNFLREFPHDIVFIENHRTIVAPDPKRIRAKAKARGISISEDALREFGRNFQHNLVRKQLLARGFDLAEVPPLPVPDYLEAYFIELEAEEETQQELQLARSRSHRILHDVRAENLRDLWLAFFYRFSDYPARIGRHSNIRPIQEEARIQIIPEAGQTIFHRPAKARVDERKQP